MKQIDNTPKCTEKKDAFVQINMGMASSCQGSVTSG